MTEYRRADEVAHIAWETIQSHHPHLEHIRIDYVWRDQAASKGGKAVLGKARKVGGLNAFLARNDGNSDDYMDFFVMEIAEDTWAGMDANQRKALVDHELLHMGLNDKAQLTIIPHDCEAFNLEIVRHGLWKGDIAELVEIGKGVTRLNLVPEPAAAEA